jgi:hypothetical protein
LEKERQEHEEYLKLKAAFSVEEEGYEEGGGDEEQNSLLQEFINYIKVLNGCFNSLSCTAGFLSPGKTLQPNNFLKSVDSYVTITLHEK